MGTASHRLRDGHDEYLSVRRLRIVDFATFAKRSTDSIKANAERLAAGRAAEQLLFETIGSR